LQFFGVSAVKLKDPLAGERPFEPVVKLSGGIDLIVMPAVGEGGHLVQVFGEPGCVLITEQGVAEPNSVRHDFGEAGHDFGQGRT
jgi:hypothetical protein